MAPMKEPPEEAFDVNEENEGGEGVALDSTAANRDGVSGEACGGLEDDACGCIGIDVLNRVNSINRVPEFSHDTEQFGVADSIEGISEINVHDIDIAVRLTGILEGMNESLEVVRGIMSHAKPFLGLAEDTTFF